MTIWRRAVRRVSSRAMIGSRWNWTTARASGPLEAVLALELCAQENGMHQRDATEKEPIDEPAEEAVALELGKQPRTDAHREPERQKDFHVDIPTRSYCDIAENSVSPNKDALSSIEDGDVIFHNIHYANPATLFSPHQTS